MESFQDFYGNLPVAQTLRQAIASARIPPYFRLRTQAYCTRESRRSLRRRRTRVPARAAPRATLQNDIGEDMRAKRIARRSDLAVLTFTPLRASYLADPTGDPTGNEM